MDQTLRCNNQIGGFCRKELTDEAVVTTCSHIFCLGCANKTQFTTALLNQRVCPVCRTALPQRDDAVQTRINPSDDYKTSVLSGLNPTTIMECVSRAMSFWTYQTTQEIFYQEHLHKIMTDKYGQLSTAMDKIINEANSEISALQTKISTLSVDQSTLQEKYDELANHYRDKSKRAAQTQQLYDALKKKVLMRSVETAATANVAQTLQSMNGARASANEGQAGQEVFHPQNSVMRRERRDCEHPDLLGNDLRQCAARRSSDSGKYVDGMGPPSRPVMTRMTDAVVAARTPNQRTSLPLQGRATANRSQIPISSVRQDIRPRYSAQGYVPMQRHGDLDGSAGRGGATTPRSFGMLGGMKVGRAGGSGIPSTEPRFTRPEGMF